MKLSNEFHMTQKFTIRNEEKLLQDCCHAMTHPPTHKPLLCLKEKTGRNWATGVMTTETDIYAIYCFMRWT